MREQVSFFFVWLLIILFIFMTPCCSLLDSTHGGSYGMHDGMIPNAKYQLFGTLNFPVTETEAWKEKVIN